MTAVVVSFNQEALLPNAVRSLATQTLRSVEIIIVDDCSTDETDRVVQELMEEDERIRYVKLDKNSGGAGAPRNRGIDEARAPYVLFLDGDDVYERHALKNMLLAAEREDAVVVTGRTDRFDMATRRREGWYPHLYAERRVIESISEFPKLIHDTAATTKLYSTSFIRTKGLRFDEHIHYEDVLFMAEVCAAIGRTVILPERVYDWRVYPVDVRKSITNQRDSLANLRDRVHVLTEITRIFAPLGEEIQDEYAMKVLRHHVRLYLNDMLGMTDDDAHTVLDELRPLIEQQPREDFAELFPFERFLYASALDGDANGVRRAVLAERDGVTAGYFAPGDSDDREWFPDAATQDTVGDDDFTRELRTSTDDRLVRFPHTQTKYLHRATSIRQSGTTVKIEGVTDDPFGELASRLKSGVLSLRTQRTAELASVPLAWAAEPGRLLWSVEIEAPARKKLRENEKRYYRIELTLDSGAFTANAVRLGGIEPVSIKDSSIVGRVLDDRWVSSDEPFGMALFGIEQGPRGRAVRHVARWALRPLRAPRKHASGWARTARRRLGMATRARGPIGLRWYAIMRRLPLRPDTALFEAHMGRSVSDSPGAVFRELIARRPDLDVSWVTPGGRPVDGLDRVTEIRRDSWKYLAALARSQYLVDNQSFPPFFRKRAGQRYLQTWHGIPLKTMGLDEPRNQSEHEREQLLEVSRQWDGLVVPNPYFEETFVPAFGYRGKLIRYGTPRCDALVNGELDGGEIRRRLEIPAESQVVLYAPTFREHQRSRKRAVPLPFNLIECQRSLPDDVILVLRSHYLNRFAIPRRSAGFCIDGSSVDDINELYQIADVLVTDYSSVMFDFALTGRPIITYAYDWDDYAERSRGTYFDLRTEGPGTFVESEDELYDSIRKALSEGAPLQQEAFRASFAGREDGMASTRAVDFLLGDQP